MLRNYLITAFRNFRNNRFYSLVNVFGLSIGITCCLVVYCIMKHELTFDSWHPEAHKIYRVVEHYQADWGMSYNGVMPNALPAALSSEAGDQFNAVITLHGPETSVFEFKAGGLNKAFEEDGTVVYANSSLLAEMDFPILSGAGPEALDEPFKVFLTEKIAMKYFGKENPIGQSLTMDEYHQVTVVGVLKNTPTNTNVPFDVLVSYPTVQKVNGGYLESWESYWSGTAYVKIEDPSHLASKEALINQLVANHIEDQRQERTQYFLQPLSDIHTNTQYDDGVNYVAPSEILIGFVLLASITLMASILNFINLATAQAVKRSKEIGIRKTLGSSRLHLASQFLGETFLIVALSTFLAFTFGQFFITKMNQFLSIVSFEIGYDTTTVLFASGLAILVTLLAGFYPALVLSGYNPIKALHNQIAITTGSGRITLRKSLVVGQFVIANLLIICTVIVSAQMSFVKNKDLGFVADQVLLMNIPSSQKEKLPIIKNEVEALNFVKSTSIQFSPPQADYNWNTGYQVADIEQTDNLNTNLKFIDKNYLELYEIPLLAGRNIDNSYHSDTTLNLLVNREFLQRVNIEPTAAIGLSVDFMGSRRGNIVGVVEDFHNWSLDSKMGPVLMMQNPGQMSQVAIKTNGKNYQQYINELERIFRANIPEGYLEVQVLQKNIQESYIVENLVHGVFQIFAGMAILIALLGLYGLVSFVANQKRKSISIRKVFGASQGVILGIFGKEYVVLMVISFLIAAPLSYLLSEEWLNGFYYRIPIGASYFVISFVAVIVITLVTIGSKSLQAANANPVDALRNE